MTLNERISAWFEPKPNSGLVNTIIQCNTVSPLHCWVRSEEALPSNRRLFGEWQAISWDTDEAANARLLEAMPEPCLFINHVKVWQCWPHGYNYWWNGGKSEDRKIAICMAFCKFAGIELDEKEKK